jgi:hypothetical protein
MAAWLSATGENVKKLSNAIKLLLHDRTGFYIALLNNLSFLIPDKLFLQLMYRCRVGCKLNLDAPTLYNEKLQWLKLYNRNPLYTVMVDKYAVKKWVAERIGQEYVIPLLGVWDDARKIDFDSLPNQFVLKTTNGGGGDVVICKDKSEFDKKKAIRHLNDGLKIKIYRTYGEWPYKNVPPQIIAEKFISDGNEALVDYKVMCFDGEPKLIELHEGRFQSHTQDFYDVEWNHLPIVQGTPMSGKIIERPSCLDKMLSLSRQLAKDIPHVRVDWYLVRGELLFGEMTFFDASGFEPFEPREYEELMGSWITLPSKRI